MHFGKRLEVDLVERWRPHYLQYKLLKKHIKEMEKHMREGLPQQDTLPSDDASGLLANQQISYQEFSFPGPKAQRFSLLSSFKPILDKEVEKVNVFTTSKVAELQNRILQLLRTSPPWKSLSGALSVAEANAAEHYLAQQLAEAETVADELVALDKFIRQNCIAIQKIIKKFDKRLQFDVAPWLNAQLMENEPFLKVNLDAMLIAISDVFEKVNSQSAEFKHAQSGGVKAKDDVKKGISAQSFERKTTKYWIKSEHLMAIKVSILKNLPVYLFDRKSADGPPENYKTRNFLRDFGDLYGNISDASPITSIYLDNDNMDVYRTRLIREEGAQLFRLRWYGDAKSLPDKEYVFVERKTHHESWVNAKSVKERFPIRSRNVQAFLEGKYSPAESMKKWMKPDNKGLKLIKNDAELEKAITLATESFQAVQSRKLKPMVRTLYRRTAFQARDHNEVRISIDTNLMMVNEDVVPAANNEFPWCRDMVHSYIPPADILQFPYCILEVKLNTDNPPKWITDLLADTHSVVECIKFSKFLTGIAYHQYKKVPEIPHWFKDQVAIDPRNRYLSSEEREKLIYRDAAVKFASTQEEREAIDTDAITAHAPDSPPVPKRDSGKSKLVDYHAIDMAADDSGDEKSPLLREAGQSSRSESVATRNREMMSDSGVINTLRNRFLGKFGESKSEALKPVRSADRIKIEPKTSFANERTLIQWVSAASLMITLATLIMTSGSPIGFKAGFVFFPLAFVIMLYAIIRYQYRAWSFRNRRNAYHDDLYGPVFLVIAIASAMGVIMYLMFHYSADPPVMLPSHNPEMGCQQLSVEPIDPYFAFSDVALIGEDLVTVGPFAYATLRSGSSKWDVTSMPNMQVVSVVGLPGSEFTYFGIEKPVLSIVKKSSASDVETTYDLKALKDNYNITLKAMAIMDEDLLLIADMTGALYKISLSPTNVELVSQIPSSRLARGLVNDAFYTHISGMWNSPDDNKLYVLFGASRLLRVFESTNITMINEWYLPGTSMQWSGVSVVKSDTEAHVFLSQSVPGSIWKFELTKEAKELKAPLAGGFPACANVYDGNLAEIMLRNPDDKFRRAGLRYVADY